MIKSISSHLSNALAIPPLPRPQKIYTHSHGDRPLEIQVQPQHAAGQGPESVNGILQAPRHAGGQPLLLPGEQVRPVLPRLRLSDRSVRRRALD